MLMVHIWPVTRVTAVLLVACAIAGCASRQDREPVVLAPSAQPAVAETVPVQLVAVEVPGPSPGTRYTWISGYWGHLDNRWVWLPGHWELSRPGEYWAPGHWAATDEGYEYTPGRGTASSDSILGLRVRSLIDR
jgi:hypothetical protein